MPKLITVVAALAIAALAGPALAQDVAPPPTGAEPTPAPGDESEPAPTADAPTEAPTTRPSDVDAPATQPAGAAATQPGDVDAAASQPSDVDAPATQPAGAATQPAAVGPDTPVEEDGAPAAGGGTLLSGDVTRPDVMERRLVAYVSTGVAAVALGTGITLGTLALGKYDCLNDVLACNEGLEQPIVGEAFLDQKAEVETLSLLADMAYVVAAAATIVAVTGYIRGYWLTDEDAGAEVTP